MYIATYCTTPPTNPPSGVLLKYPQTLNMRTGCKTHFNMKLFIPCDSATESPQVDTPYVVTSETLYNPSCEGNECNSYTQSTISYNGTFYYTVTQPDGTVVQTADLTLLTGNVFSFSVTSLNEGKYYLTINYVTSNADNKYTFALVVSA